MNVNEADIYQMTIQFFKRVNCQGTEEATSLLMCNQFFVEKLQALQEKKPKAAPAAKKKVVNKKAA